MIYLGLAFISLMKFIGFTAFASLAHSTFASRVGLLSPIHRNADADPGDSIPQLIGGNHTDDENGDNSEETEDNSEETHDYSEETDDNSEETDYYSVYPQAVDDAQNFNSLLGINAQNSKTFFEQLRKFVPAGYHPTLSDLNQVSRAVFLESWNTYSNGGKKLKKFPAFPPEKLDPSAELPLAFLLNMFYRIHIEKEIGLLDEPDGEMLREWIGIPEDVEHPEIPDDYAEETDDYLDYPHSVDDAQNFNSLLGINAQNSKTFFKQLKKVVPAGYHPPSSELDKVSKEDFNKFWHMYTDGGEEGKVFPLFPPAELKKSALIRPLAFLLTMFYRIHIQNEII